MTIGDLIVRVGAQIDGFKSAMAEVPQIANTATGKVSGAVNSMTTSITASLASVGSKLASVGTMMTIGLTVPIVGLGAASIKAASEMESLKLALNAITHNAAETEKQMARLKEVAKIPGLDFQGAVKGSVNLQAAGFSATMAERALKAFGNALATVGKGREDLEGVNLVLTQILNKPKVMAQDLNQLRERLPQISGMMKAAFGSSVSEDIQKLGITGEQFVAKIITEFEKLPPVTSGLKNTFENVRDASFQALAKLGDNLAPIAMRVIDVVINPLITAVSKAASAFGTLPGPVQNAALGMTAFLVVAGPAATIVGKLTTAVISLAGIYTTLSTLITARVIPALFGTQAAASAAQMGTAAMTGTFAAFGSTAAAATTAATTGALSLQAALGGIVLVLGAVVAGYIAWKNAQAQIKPLDTSRPEGALGENFAFSGFGATPITPPKKAPANAPGWQYLKMQGGSAEDYVTGLPAPRPTAGGVDTERLEKLKAAFSQLGLKDRNKELQESIQALQLLGGAGLLTHDQMMKAAAGIAKMREELKGAKPEAIGLVNVVAGGMPTLEELANLPMGRLGATMDEVLGMPHMSAISRGLEMVNAAIIQQANDADVAARNAGYLTDAYHYFGLRTPEELRKVAAESRDAYEMMQNSGTAAPEAIYAAWEQMTRDKYALLLADGKVTKQQYDDMLAAIDASHKKSTTRRKEYEWSAAEDMKRAMGSAFDSTYRALARSIVDWKDWGKNLKNVVLDLAENMLSIMLKVFMKPLEDAAVKLAGKLGGVLGGIFGGGGSAASTAASGASTAAGGASSAAGGATSAVGGLAGAVNMISGVVSAVSGVIGNFQFMGMNKSLDVIVNHTLATANDLANLRRDEWDREGHLMLKLDDMWNEIRNVVSAIHDISLPQMQMAGAPGTVNINVYGASDTEEVVNRVAQHLKRNGVYV